MKTEHSMGKIKIALTITALVGASLVAQADVYWGGYVSADWSDPDNWAAGFPTNAGAGNAIINAGAYPCVVSNSGNYTVDGVYVSISGASLSVTNGGALSIATTLVTGVWGASAPVDVSGQLNMGGYLNIGAGGFDGDVRVFGGGTVESAALSINSTGGAKLDVGTNGTFITAYSQLGNVNYWIANNAITASDNAPGWSLDVDTNSMPGKLILTSSYTTPSASTNFVFDNGGSDNVWTNATNWNPDGVPGNSDTATVAGGLYVTVASDVGNVGQLTVGATNGEGAVNFNAGCNISLRDTNMSLVVGGVTNGGAYPSYCIFNGGNAGTVGDVVLGASGGWVDARHYGGTNVFAGTLRIGSYQYPTNTSPTNVSLRLIGSSGSISGMSAIEVGAAATLAYEFAGSGSIKSLIAAGAVNISTGAVLVVDGTGYSGSTVDLTLLQGATLSGAFTTATITNFPNGVSASLVYTSSRLKLSVVSSQPNFGLNIQSVGAGTNQISWSLGRIATATNINGPWAIQGCATSPLLELVGGGQKFYRGVLVGEKRTFDNESTDNLWTTASNWNPDGLPGTNTDAFVPGGRSVFVTSAAANTGSVTVGDTVGNGALNINPGGSLTLVGTCKAVIIGGGYAAPNNYASYYRQGGGDLITAGDFVLGLNGGRADAQFAGPGVLSIGGSVLLGSAPGAGYSFFELPGDAGSISAGGLEVGGAGELIYNFNGGFNLKTLTVTGAVTLQSGSTITIRGNGYPAGPGSYNYTLIQGGSRSGTFAVVNVTGFPVVGTSATVGYSGGNVTLQVIVP